MTGESVRSVTCERDIGWEIAHAAVSRRPPISLARIVARAEGYTHAANVWDLSVVQGPLSVAPCQALPLRFANFPSLYVAPYLGHAARLVLVQDGVQAAVAALRQRPRQRDVAQPHARRRRRVPRRGVRPLQNRPACVG